MFEINLIRETLREYIGLGGGVEKKFIIYPFGVNGVNVKNVLKDCYDLEPCFIVDNEYYRYNHNIINDDILKNVYQKEMYIILTIENEETNSEILKKFLSLFQRIK